MPVLVAGHREVTLKVPDKSTDRVRLFYTDQFDVVTRGRGDTAIRFKPCREKPRTIFPGGIRVSGREAVSLLVIEEGSAPHVLPLGRPGAAYAG